MPAKFCNLNTNPSRLFCKVALLCQGAFRVTPSLNGANAHKKRYETPAKRHLPPSPKKCARLWRIFINLLCFPLFSPKLPDNVLVFQHFWRQLLRGWPFVFQKQFVGKFGKSLGGNQPPPELLGSPRTSPEVSQTSPETSWRLTRSSVTVELNSNPGVPRKLPRLRQKFPGFPRKFPGLPRRTAPCSGKPDTLS